MSSDITMGMEMRMLTGLQRRVAQAPHCSRGRARSAKGQRGAILLEVVLALVIFVTAATIIGIALSSSIGAVDRLRLGAHAANFSTTVFSELQIGARSLADTGPEPFGPERPGWTWEVVSSPWGDDRGDAELGARNLTLVEVIIRQEDVGFVHRASQVIQVKPAAESTVLAATGRISR